MRKLSIAKLVFGGLACALAIAGCGAGTNGPAPDEVGGDDGDTADASVDGDEPEGSGADEEPADELVRVRAMSTNLYDLGMPGTEAGIETGVFEEFGLDVDIVIGQEVAESLATGDVDVAHGAPNRFIGAILQGLEAKIIGSAYPIWGQFFIVNNDLGISSLDEFEGGTIGVSRQGSAGHYSAVKLAEEIGLDEEDYEIVPVGGLDALMAGVRSGQIDAFAWGASAAVQLEHEGAATIVADIGAEIGATPLQVIVASEAAIAENPDAIRTFCEGYYETVKRLQDDYDETLRMIIEDWDFDPETADDILSVFADNWSLDSSMSDEMFENMSEATRFTIEDVDPDLDGEDVKAMYQDCSTL